MIACKNKNECFQISTINLGMLPLGSVTLPVLNNITVANECTISSLNALLTSHMKFITENTNVVQPPGKMPGNLLEPSPMYPTSILSPLL